MPPRRQGPRPSRSRSVLIVEDDALLALEATLILEAGGYDVVGVAATSSQAARLAAGADAGMALVDLNLADGRTGSAVAKMLADAGWTVVMATGQPSDVVPGTPALKILQKPYPAEALLKAIHEAARRLGEVRAATAG